MRLILYDPVAVIEKFYENSTKPASKRIFLKGHSLTTVSRKPLFFMGVQAHTVTYRNTGLHGLKVFRTQRSLVQIQSHRQNEKPRNPLKKRRASPDLPFYKRCLTVSVAEITCLDFLPDDCCHFRIIIPGGCAGDGNRIIKGGDIFEIAHKKNADCNFFFRDSKQFAVVVLLFLSV